MVRDHNLTLAIFLTSLFSHFTLTFFKEKRKRKYELLASMLALLEGQPASSKENESLLAPLSVYESFHIGVFTGKGFA
jgi:hypothetical protein